MDWPAAYTPNTGPMDAFMLVQLKGKPVQLRSVRLRVGSAQSCSDEFPEVEIAFDTGGMLTAALNMGEPSPIHFQVQGPNLETSQQIAGSSDDTASRRYLARPTPASPSGSTTRSCTSRWTASWPRRRA